MPGKQYSIKMPIKIKTYDIDFNSHVSNIVYIRWLEDLRLELLYRYLPYEELVEKNLSPVLLRTEIEYRRAIRMFEPVMAYAQITGFEGIRMQMNFQFSVQEQVRAVARQIGVFIHLGNGRPVRLPKDFLERFQAAG